MAMTNEDLTISNHIILAYLKNIIIGTNPGSTSYPRNATTYKIGVAGKYIV